MRAKEFVVEADSHQPPEFIADYIAKIHTGATRADDEELLEWIYSFDSFKLVTVNLASIETRYSGLNPDLVNKYEKRPNPPPIVIDGTNGWIIDGYHRANAAKKRGDKTIQAYVGQQGVTEASYPGNIGMMEVAKFFNMATPKEKIIFERLMNMGEKNKAWQLIQQVTGVKLQGKEFDLVAEGLQNNGISFRVQKGKNKFATTMTVNNEQVGVYQYDATTGRSIAEIYPEFKGKGFGKLLVLHAIYTAAKLGLDFQVDESRTAEYDNVLDSLSSNSYIVDDDGYWYVTGEGEQYLQQSLKQGVAEGSEQSLSSMRSQDQSERNEYEQLVKSQAGGDWSKGAKMYAQLKKRPSTDIFGDAVRQDKFMKMKFNFDKFTDKDWEDYWTLAQHCDKNRDFQKNALSVIKKYQGMGHDNYKFLYDRISKGLTGKQKYGTQNGYKASGVTEGLSIDVPNEEWLQDKIDYAKSKGRDEWGAPFFGSTTAYARPNPQVSVVRLELLKGMRNEQDNVRSKDLEWLMAHMEKTGKLPLNDRGEEYAPYVMVAYNGEAWVSEGNHRIMAAYRLGRKTLPVQLAYFDGGERVESGIMYPKKIGL